MHLFICFTLPKPTLLLNYTTHGTVWSIFFPTEKFQRDYKLTRVRRVSRLRPLTAWGMKELIGRQRQSPFRSAFKTRQLIGSKGDSWSKQMFSFFIWPSDTIKLARTVAFTKEKNSSDQQKKQNIDKSPYQQHNVSAVQASSQFVRTHTPMSIDASPVC